MNLQWKRIIPIVVLAAIWTGGVNGFAARAESDTFPVYPCIQPNIAFWIKIYTEYPSSQGIIHDKNKMDRIYGVIELVDPYRSAGRKINKQRIRKAKKRYRAILAKLMRGRPPTGPVERKVAEFFGPDTKPAEFRSAMRSLRCQVGQKDRFRDGVIRSGAYIDEIQRIFRDYGLPEDLAYLPHVESSFNPKAYSKFGAAGIWQFTRSTGRRYMKIGYTIDERRDPILSSYAAAKLLQQNYLKLEDWALAITAYNHGTAGMLRAKKSRGSYEAIFKRYRSRTFRFASRNFYAEFLAAREAARNYRRYFGNLKLDVPVPSQELVLTGYVSLPEVARYLKVEIADLRRLNPALRRPVFRGEKYVPRGYRLRVPFTSDENRESLIAQLPDKLYKHNQKRSRIYTVRRGDTAGEIARAHGVKLSDLIAANNLDRRATIYVDQNLRIPQADKKPIQIAKRQPPEFASKHNRAELRSERVQNDAGAPSPAKRTEQVPDSSDRGGREPAEDEGPVIVAATGKNVENEAPSLHPEILRGHFAVERVWIQNRKPVGIIRVDVEETLGHYAEWLKVSASEIRRLNGYQYGRTLHLNQALIIPLHKVDKEEFEEQRFEYHKELAEDFFATYRVEKVLTYSIKKGDNIWTLSRDDFEVPLWLLKRFNAEVNFNNLIPSQKLLIPIVEKNV